MTSERECFVYIVLPGATEFVTAGRYRWTGDGTGAIGRFVYGRSYRERADAVEVDPVELRLSGQVHETARMQGFFGAIRDAMPDFWGRRVIERNAVLGELAEFDYLLQGPGDRAGALGFGLNVEPPAPRRRFNRTLDLARLQRAADAILSGDPDLAGSSGKHVEELLLLGTSMGGARPKAVVRDERDLWMAKFGRNDDRWNSPRVEHGMLVLARSCGLNVADSRVTAVAGQELPVLLQAAPEHPHFLGGLDVALRFRRFDATPVCLHRLLGAACVGEGAAVGLPGGRVAGVVRHRPFEVVEPFPVASRLEAGEAERVAQQGVVGAAREHRLEAFDVHVTPLPRSGSGDSPRAPA